MSILEQLRLLHVGWRDVLEVVIVSYAVYRVLLLLHRTRAMQVLAGIIILAGAYGVAYALQLTMIIYLLTLVFSYGVIALLVVFAPEIRAALAQLGRSRDAHPLTQLGDHVANDIGAVRRMNVRRHLGHAAPRVHQHHAGSGRGTHRGKLAVEAEPRHVVHDRHAGGERFVRDAGLHCID